MITLFLIGAQSSNYTIVTNSVFEGLNPMLVVAEPELIKDIMVRDFNCFLNRRIMSFNDPILDRALGIVTDDQWKGLRSAVREI